MVSHCQIVSHGEWKGLDRVRRLEWVGDLPGSTTVDGCVGPSLTVRLGTADAAMLVQCDAPRHIVACNRAWEKQSGFDAQEACGRAPSILYGASTDKALVEEQWAACIANRHCTSEITLINYNKSGRPVKRRVTSKVVVDSRGTEYLLTTSCELERRTKAAISVPVLSAAMRSIASSSVSYRAAALCLVLMLAAVFFPAFLLPASSTAAAATGASLIWEAPPPVLPSCLAVSCIAAFLAHMSTSPTSNIFRFNKVALEAHGCAVQ